jgi:alkylated DNA repair dioxygenase AlkB
MSSSPTTTATSTTTAAAAAATIATAAAAATAAATAAAAAAAQVSRQDQGKKRKRMRKRVVMKKLQPGDDQITVFELDEDNKLVLITDAVIITNEEDVKSVMELIALNPRRNAMFGNQVPRFEQHFDLVGDRESYTYSRRTYYGANGKHPRLLDDSLKAVQMYFPETEWNACFANYYPTGKDYISPHSDDEKCHVSGSTIVGVSFGATREFKVKPTTPSECPTGYVVSLPHNSIVAMVGETFQKRWTHEVPKSEQKQPRLSFTFRSFKKTK